MPLLAPNVGENKLLEFALGKATPGNQTLKLFVNNITPGATDVAGTYTEMSTLGYAAKTLTTSSWTVTNVSGSATAAYAQQSWTFTAGTSVTIYGYFVIDSTTGILLWAERFSAPIAVDAGGDALRLTPSFTLTSA